MASPVGIGDVIALGNLCVDIVDLIKDIKAAPKEFAQYVIELQRLTSSCNYLKKELEPSIDVATEIDSEIGNVVRSTHASLTSIRERLQHDYVELRSTSNPTPLQKLRSHWKWRKSRGILSKEFDRSHRGMDHLNLLLCVELRESISDLKQSCAAILLEVNHKPRSLGLPGSGGSPREDHVQLASGLGTSMDLLLTLCSRLETFQNFLPLAYSKYPGESKICNRQYKLYYTNSQHPVELNEQNWTTLVRPGASLSLAFVVCTTVMCIVNFCPKCKSPNKGNWQTWRSCRCGFSYFVTEAGELDIDYEPVDVSWDFRSNCTKVWNPSTMTTLDKVGRSLTRGPSHLSQFMADEKDDYSEGQLEAHIDEAHEDWYYRCAIVVFDPIFNQVYRNVFCRCILAANCPRSHAPRLDILTINPCPTHSLCGFPKEAFKDVTDIVYDYESDIYFEKYGGYQNFRAMARDTISLLPFRPPVHLDKLCAATDVVDFLMDFPNLTEKERAACDEYEIEVLQKWVRLCEVYRNSQLLDCEAKQVLAEWLPVCNEKLNAIAQLQKPRNDDWMKYRPKLKKISMIKGRLSTEVEEP